MSHDTTKIIWIGLALFVGGYFISAHADDTPAQAAARAALDKMWNESGNAPAPPALGSHPDVPVVQPGKPVVDDATSIPRTQATWQAASTTARVEAAGAPATAGIDRPDPCPPADDPASPMADVVMVAEILGFAKNNDPAPAVEFPPNGATTADDTPKTPAPFRAFYPTAQAGAGAVTTTVTQSARTAEEIQAKPAPAVAKPLAPRISEKPASEMKTTDGTVYNNPYVEKILPDGIIVSYSTASGGMGITKLFFDSLPDEVRRKYQKP